MRQLVLSVPFAGGQGAVEMEAASRVLCGKGFRVVAAGAQVSGFSRW